MDISTLVHRQTECHIDDVNAVTPRVVESLLDISDTGSNGLLEYDLADSTVEFELFPIIPIVGSETAMAALSPKPRQEASVSQSHTSPEGFLEDSVYQPHPVRDTSKKEEQKWDGDEDEEDEEDVPEPGWLLKTKAESQPNGLSHDVARLTDSCAQLLKKSLLDRSKSHPNGLTRIVLDKTGSLPNGLTRALVTRAESQPLVGPTTETAEEDEEEEEEEELKKPSNGYIKHFLDSQGSIQSIDGLLEESVSQLNRITNDLLGDTVL